MTRLRVAVFALAVAVAAAAAHLVHYQPRLPATVASHFDGAGRPDGWTSRGTFLTIHAVTVGGLAALFAGLAAILPRLPDHLINLPARDHWLAPERRAETLATIAAAMLWIGAGTIAFLVAVVHLTFRVSMGIVPDLGTAFWIALVGFLAALGGLVAWLLWRFRRPAGTR